MVLGMVQYLPKYQNYYDQSYTESHLEESVYTKPFTDDKGKAFATDEAIAILRANAGFKKGSNVIDDDRF